MEENILSTFSCLPNNDIGQNKRIGGKIRPNQIGICNIENQQLIGVGSEASVRRWMENFLLP